MSDDSRRRARGPQLLSVLFRDVLFAHWDVDPSVVAETLPRGLSVDTRDGRAWLGIVPLVMGIGPRFPPVQTRFGQVNLRTYVRGPGGTPGVYFYALNAGHRLGAWAGRTLMRLPYHRATVDVEHRGRRVRFRSERTGAAEPPARFRVTYGPVSEKFEAEDGSLSQFLVERYRLFTEGTAWSPVARSPDEPRPPRSGGLYYADIDHEPWQLAEAAADIEENELFAAEGFDDPTGDPRCHYAHRKKATAGPLHRV